MELGGKGKVVLSMPEVFLCGPLTNIALLESVLGRPVAPDELSAATLDGYLVSGAIGQPGVVVAKSRGGKTKGFVIEIADAEERRRLAYFQGGYGFILVTEGVTLDNAETVAAQVFVTQAGGAAGAEPWDQEKWVGFWSDIAVAASCEIMAQVDQLSADQVAERLKGIHIRAASYVSAQARAVPVTRDLERDVVVHARHRRYSNFFAAEEMDLQYRRYDGDMSPVLNRGAQILGRAAVVLPYDPVLDAVLMVEQFRAPLFMGGDRDPWLWQPVAGLVDPGETAEGAAQREAIEEAGLTLSNLFRVAGAYSSPGANSDFVSLFVGIGDFSTRAAGGGLAEEGEDIKVRIVDFDELMEDIDAGRHRDMQLILTSLWLARHRNRLR